MLHVLVVSDATGETADRVVRAALAQFEAAQVNVTRHHNIDTDEKVRAVVKQASREGSLVVHTLVSDRLRRLMLEEARVSGVDALDMLGPLLERLAAHLQLTPKQKPGLFRQLTEAKTRQMDAVSFAFRHDDGQNAEDLGRAELVLVGVSRTMKTPTMLYLAYRGWFAANVPLVPGVAPPTALDDFPPSRVVCLQMSPQRLLQLRCERAKSESIPLEPYASPEQIREEIHFAQLQCRRRGWLVVDVTAKSVEEVVREIIALLPEPSRI